jgi:hypothetical protein
MSQQFNDSSDCVKVADDAVAARSLAVGLALSVAGSNSGISSGQGRAVEAWARRNGVNLPKWGRGGYVFAKLIARLIAVFPRCHVARAAAFSKAIAEIAPFAMRCSILELCLLVVRAGGFASVGQLVLLKRMACRFEIKMDRFRLMMEKIVPVTMHEAVDMEISFGVTEEMDRAGVCCQLSKEYSKWNSRITNSKRQVRTEAEIMLKLVSQARKLYEK